MVRLFKLALFESLGVFIRMISRFYGLVLSRCGNPPRPRRYGIEHEYHYAGYERIGYEATGNKGTRYEYESKPK